MLLFLWKIYGDVYTSVQGSQGVFFVFVFFILWQFSERKGHGSETFVCLIQMWSHTHTKSSMRVLRDSCYLICRLKINLSSQKDLRKWGSSMAYVTTRRYSNVKRDNLFSESTQIRKPDQTTFYHRWVLEWMNLYCSTEYTVMWLSDSITDFRARNDIGTVCCDAFSSQHLL